MNRNRNKNNNAEWARLIFSHYADCIESVKRRQWAATNYVLAIFAAAIAYANLYENYTNAKILLVLLISVFLISIFGIYHLSNMHFVMTKYRNIIFNIANKYPYVKNISMIEDNDVAFHKYFLSITGLFIALILLGLLLVVLFIYELICYNLLAISMFNKLIVISKFQCLTAFLFIDIIFVICLNIYYYYKYKKMNNY